MVKNLVIFCLILCSANAISEEVIVLTTSGEQIAGLLLDGELNIRTASGVIKIPVSELVFVDFISNRKQVSGKTIPVQEIYEIGRIYAEEGKLEVAESIFTQLISSFPSDEWSDNIHYELAKIYYQKKQNEKSAQELMKVIKESSDKSLVSSAQEMLKGLMWTIYDTSDKLPSDDIRALALDKDCIWVGTSAGITQFNLSTDSVTDEVILPEEDIQALAVDDIYLWVGTLNSGIKQYNKIKKTWVSYTKKEGLSCDRVFAISIDPDSVWFGTESGGVYQHNKRDGSWTNYTMRDGLSDNSIISIASSSREVWCGTSKNGVNFFDRSMGRWQTIKDPSIFGGKSVSIVTAGADYAWFVWYESLRNGVSKYDANAGLWEEWPITEWEGDIASAQRNIENNMINIGTNDKEMWIGTDSVALCYDYSTSKWSDPYDYPSKLSGRAPVCILVEDNSVWFATPHGLGRLSKSTIGKI